MLCIAQARVAGGQLAALRIEDYATMPITGATIFPSATANSAYLARANFLAEEPGNPNRFFLHLTRLGVRVVPHPFPDHHPLLPEELEFGDEAPVMMTEKDAVKLRRYGRANWWVLPVTAQLDPAFGDWLLKELHGRRSKAA